MKVKIKHKPHRKAKWLIRILGLPFKFFSKDFIGWADDTIQNIGVHATTKDCRSLCGSSSGSCHHGLIYNVWLNPARCT